MPPTRPQRAKGPKPVPKQSSSSRPNHPRCRALHEDGSDCQEKLLQAKHSFCPSHHQEYKKLYESYKRKEKCYTSIETGEEGEDGFKRKAEAKLAAGKETLDLRDQVNRRFFNFSAENRGHIKWIMKLQSEVRVLEQKLVSRETTESAGLATSSAPVPALTPTPAPEPKGRDTEAIVSRSLFSPARIFSALCRLATGSPAIIVKQASDTVIKGMVEKLYGVAPSLDDSSSVVLDEVSNERREPDARDYVIRFLFRELLVYKADADVLSRASQIQSIDTFLHGSSVQHLEYYLKFFLAFRAGREDTFHLLRDAVCDHLLDAQSSSSTTILGAEVGTGESLRRMSTKGWDLLWEYFHDVVEWWNLEYFAPRFEDLVAVKTLAACRRYGVGEAIDEDGPNWYSPDEDISQECVLAVMQGFVGVTKGFSDTPGLPAETKRGITKETQVRCYLVGRMSKKDPLALPLVKELGARVANFEVQVYDREGAAGSPKLVSSSTSDRNPWIKRCRSAPKKEALDSHPWTVEWSLENILDDIELIHMLRDRNMDRDYYEFIIIERRPGMPFTLLDMVAEALVKLNGYPPFDHVFRQAIQRYVPSEEQGQYLDALAQTDIGQAAPLTSHQYVGNRVRCWDIVESPRGIPRELRWDPARTVTAAESRFVSEVSADLESHGIITSIPSYEPIRGIPTVAQGVDGLDDLYFHYDLGPRDERSNRQTILDFDPSRNTLVEFAEAYQLAHPAAVFAKGRINIPYCAWPMPMLPGPRFARLNFATPEGRLYRWKCLPFDLTMAPRIWQFYVNCELNNRLPFVCLVQTTLVVCAPDRDGAAASLEALTGAGEKHGWTFSVPPLASWTTDIKKLGLGSLWEGVRPAL